MTWPGAPLLPNSSNVSVPFAVRRIYTCLLLGRLAQHGTHIQRYKRSPLERRFSQALFKHLRIFNILSRTQLRALLLTITIAIIAALYRTQLPKIARSLTRPTFLTSARYQSTITTGKDMQFQYRASQTRGGADHGWLKVSYTHCRKY